MTATRIVKREWDGLQTLTTVELEDGSVVTRAGNPLTWHLFPDHPVVPQAVWTAWTVELCRTAPLGTGTRIRRAFGIHDRYNPEG